MGSDIGYTWTAPSDGFFDFNTFGSSLDTVIYARDGSCGGTELFCNDDADVFEHSSASGATRQLAQGQEIALSVDSALKGGAYQLNILEKMPWDSLGSKTGATVATGSAHSAKTTRSSAPAAARRGKTSSSCGTRASREPIASMRPDPTSCPPSTCEMTAARAPSSVVPPPVSWDLTLIAAQTVVIFLDGNAVTGAGNYVLGISKQ